MVEDHQPLIGEAVLRDGDGMILVVEKLPGASTTEVTEGIEDAIEAMRPGLSGVDIDTGVYRPATYVDHAADNLRRYALIGGALLLLGLGVFLFSWRRVLISAVAIGMSLLAAALVLYWRDATFNVVVLAGLLMALAAVVDDAVVNVDRSARRLRRASDVGASEAEPAGSFQVVLGAVLESGRTIGFALAAMVFALLPTFVLGGLAGESFYPELAVAFLVAVALSMLVALTLTPALALLLLPAEASLTRGSPLVSAARRLYQRSLAGTVQRGAVIAVGGVALIVLGVVAFLQLDRSVLPPLKETDLLITWEGPPGASLPEMDRITNRAADELARLPGVSNVDAHVGRAVRGDAVGGANSGTIWVSLDSSADYGDTVQDIETVVGGYPGLDRKVVTYSQNRISDTLATERSPVRVRLYGHDLGVLQDKANEVSALVSDVGGTRDVRVQQITTEPTIEIEVDLAAAQEAGIKPGDVRRAATTLVSGIQVGALFEEQKIFEVQVWGVPEVRRNVTDIEQLLLDVPGGGHVTLGDVAEVRIGASPTSIEHDATSRSLDVTAAVSGRRVGDVVGDIEQRLADVAFPLEYHAEVLGDYGEHTGAERRVLVFALGAALGIFLLLQAAFSSWRLAVRGRVRARRRGRGWRPRGVARRRRGHHGDGRGAPGDPRVGAPPDPRVDRSISGGGQIRPGDAEGRRGRARDSGPGRRRRHLDRGDRAGVAADARPGPDRRAGARPTDGDRHDRRSDHHGARDALRRAAALRALRAALLARRGGVGRACAGRGQRAGG